MRETPVPVLGGYPRDAARFDEALDAGGQVRPHWLKLADWMSEAGPQELNRQERIALDRISEDGVAYHVQDDPVRAARPWPLDIIPFIVSPQDWQSLERGLQQRARLLELLLCDLHGAQKSIRDGIIPAALVHGVPYFLPACQQPDRPPESMLHLYACDMIRAADGRWQVLADRTQAPAGLGFALENRVVSARLLSEPFVEDRVHRLARFFRSARETLRTLDPRKQEYPRIVLLTPGPGSETYFENAYLAHYLGYTLVEADDLTVRDDGVHLKMLGGLKRVDVILRRIDDVFCDPVELRGDSLIGVPGLMRAVRNRQVAVANALGAGLLATPALLPFLPAACRHFFGEDLRLDSVEDGWCGDPEFLCHALERADDFLFFDVAGPNPHLPLRPALMPAGDRDELLRRVRGVPGQFVAQRFIELASTPQLEQGQIQPAACILRSFLVQRESDYEAMPGGLTRVVPGDYIEALPVYRGAASKDTWVMSDVPVEQFSLLMPASAQLAINRGGGDISSRVADHLFWLGRYKERMESCVRTLRVVFLRQLEQGNTLEQPGSVNLQRLLGFYPLEGMSGLSPSAWANAALDPARSGSLAWLLETIRRNSSRVRDRFSGDTWRILNRLFVEIPQPAADDWQMLQRLIDWFNVCIIRLSAFDGMTMESMTRGPGWRFLDSGRRVERALHMLSVVETSFVERADAPLQAADYEDILSVADSLITYRRRYLTQLQLAPVVDLFLADESNPRSVAFQVERLREHLYALSTTSHQSAQAEEHVLHDLLTELHSTDLRQLADTVVDHRRVGIESWTRRMKGILPEISDVLTSRYFSHSERSRSLAGMATF